METETNPYASLQITCLWETIFFSIRCKCGSPVKVGRPEITVIIFSFYMNLALPAKKPTKPQTSYGNLCMFHMYALHACLCVGENLR